MKIFLMIAIFSLSACGFSPVHGTHGNNTPSQTASTATAFNNIGINIIPNREGQFLRNALVDRLYSTGTPTNTRYTLGITPIQEKIYNFDITQSSEATRRQLKLTTKMSLTDNQTKKEVLTHNLLSIASHNVLESEFSTIVTEQNAREDALNDLARQIERQLTLHFKK